MSGAHTTPAISPDGETTDALCVYCTPKPDGTPTTLHGICMGHDPQTGNICSCTCPKATTRRESRNKPWVRRTTWEPGRAKDGPERARP